MMEQDVLKEFESFAAKLDAASKSRYSIEMGCHKKNWDFKAFRPEIFGQIKALYNELTAFELDGNDLNAIRARVDSEEPIVGLGANLYGLGPEAHFITIFNRTAKIINLYMEALDTMTFAEHIAGNGTWGDEA